MQCKWGRLSSIQKHDFWPVMTVKVFYYKCTKCFSQKYTDAFSKLTCLRLVHTTLQICCKIENFQFFAATRQDFFFILIYRFHNTWYAHCNMYICEEHIGTKITLNTSLFCRNNSSFYKNINFKYNCYFESNKCFNNASKQNYPYNNFNNCN